MNPNIDEFSEFLVAYTAKMLSIGTYTARVNRCVCRVAKAYGYNVSLTAFTKHFSISVVDRNDHSNHRTYVENIPFSPISFTHISELSALSWHIKDERYEFSKTVQIYNQICQITLNSHIKSLLLMSVASASFCRLFGGDFGGVLAVLVATFFGFLLRLYLAKNTIDIKIQYIIVAFISSFIAYLGVYFGFSLTPDATIGSSVLYMVPGVRLINAVLDVLNENVLVGISRGISAFLLIICMAAGVYITLSFSNIGLLNV
ncbi:threonine/serine exporter family protein [Campylobacter majalis]|uniref:threonine/serine exporter family protein n=1 Tax=Campylobacter majalis TaxID=2790656 RepID=UPI003D69DAEE